MGVKIVNSDAVNSIKSVKNRKFDRRRNLIRAVMIPIDYTDSPEVLGRAGYVWCRDRASMTSDSGGVFQAFNPSVKPLNNRPVWIEPSPRAPYRMTVIGYDYTTLADSATYVTNIISSDVAKHGSSHTFIPGTPSSLYSTDVADITERNISSGRVYPTTPVSMQCFVAPVSYIYNGTVQRFSGGITQDFTANIPAAAGEAELDYVCIDGATNSLAYVRSSTFAWGSYVDPLPPAAHETIPEGYVLLSSIILYNGMTSIVERNFTYEIRPIFSAILDAQNAGHWEPVVDSTPEIIYSIDDIVMAWEP